MEALPDTPLYPSRRRIIVRRLIALLVVAAIGLAVAAIAFDVELPLIGGADGQEDLSKPPALAEVAELKRDGLTVGWPEGWRESRKGGPLRLTSPDRTVAVALSAPAELKQARGQRVVLEDAIRVIRRNYRRARVSRVTRSGRIDGYPTREAAVTARNRRGVAIRVAIAVAWRKRLAYLIEVFSTPTAPARRLVEAQTILSSLQLSK